MILDCLIDKMKSKEDMFDLCDQLSRLTDISPNLANLINELRKGHWLLQLYVILSVNLFLHIVCVNVYGGALVNVYTAMMFPSYLNENGDWSLATYINEVAIFKGVAQQKCHRKWTWSLHNCLL